MNSKELSQKEAELILEKQNEYFNSQATKDVDFRIAQLKLLKSSIKRYEEQIVEALKKDLGKHKCESYATEIGFVYNSISCIIRNLRKWARPQKKRTPLFLMPAKSYVVREPYGSVLIIAPFNYPFQLVFEPLAGALAAGNTAVVKTSELAPNVSKVVKNSIEETFAGQYVKCVEGGVQTVSELLSLKFGYIFFTGSAQTEKKVLLEVSAGNVTINDTILHIANHNLPFGGTGNSGIGNYHGKYSFTTFSHQKGILKKPEMPGFKFMYPPFTEKNLNIIKWFLR